MINGDFKKTLWATADKLRSNMDAAEYKHIVLGLIFLKYVSDSFAEHRAKLEERFADPNDEYFIEDHETRAKDLEVSKGTINNVSTYEKGVEPSRAKRKLSHGDIVISTVRPDRGSYFLALNAATNLIASTGFAVFTPHTVPFSFLYIFLTDEEQLTFYGKRADGAAYPAINQSVISEMELVIPADEILSSFHSITEPILSKTANNLREGEWLCVVRDSLLPRLIS